jgi:hypothetical protein
MQSSKKKVKEPSDAEQCRAAEQVNESRAMQSNAEQQNAERCRAEQSSKSLTPMQSNAEQQNKPTRAE